MNIIEKLKLLVLINKLYKQIMEVKMLKSWKTSLGAIVTTIGFILKLFKIDVPEEVSMAVITVGIFIIGIFSKDSNVTGGTVQQ